MTDKQIKEGIDVSQCECYSVEDNSCNKTLSGSCIKEKCQTFRLLQTIKAKEQECEGLKEEIKTNGFGHFNIEMAEQLDQLKVELEQEKALKETYLACYKAKHEDIEGALFKLKQTLAEIKAICNNNDELQGDFNVVDCDKYKLGKHNLANKILQKIIECEVENDR